MINGFAITVKANLDVTSCSHFLQTFEKGPFESSLEEFDVLVPNPDLNL